MASRGGVAPWAATTTAADDDEALAAMVNLLVVLADNKYWLGRHLSEWSVGSPSLEVGVACAAIAQGELGQARVLHPLLEELPFPDAGFSALGLAPDRDLIDRGLRPTNPRSAMADSGGGGGRTSTSGPQQPWPAPVDPARRGRGYHVALLDAPFPTWPHAVAALLLVDTATLVMLEALRGSGYEALARRVPRMLEEEAFHQDFTAGRVQELARMPGGAAQLRARVTAAVAEMLCWFGPPGEPGVEALRRHGLIARGNQELRQDWLDRVGPPLAAAGVTVPWPDHPDELPWTRWNRLQRRLGQTAPTLTGKP